MKLTLGAFYLFAIYTLSAGSALACTCGELTLGTVISTGPALSENEVAKWRKEQTNYALFTGQVIKIEKIKVKQTQGSNDKSSMKKVTVKVESYWLGVTQAKMVNGSNLRKGSATSFPVPAENCVRVMSKNDLR